MESGRLLAAAERARQVGERLHQARRRLISAAAVMASLFLLWHVMYAPNGAMVYQQKRATVKQLEVDLKTLRSENASYAKRVEGLKNDPHVIESEARQQLHFVRPGEHVYVTPRDVSAPPPALVTAQKD